MNQLLVTFNKLLKSISKQALRLSAITRGLWRTKSKDSISGMRLFHRFSLSFLPGIMAFSVLFSLSLFPAFSDTLIIPVTGDAAQPDSTTKNDFISLEEFNRQVKGGDPGSIRGVYVEDILAHRVIQQPAGNQGFVSNIQDMVTQFGLAQKHGTIGLLAHNFSAGSVFTDLKEGQIVHVSYGDGSVKSYRINQILRFQALQPDSPNSSFIHLETNEYFTTEELFSLVYTGNHRLVLQTCIQQGDEDSWGRLFVMADPV